MRPFLLLLSRTHSELYNSERMIYTFSSFGFDQNYLLFFSLLHHVKDLLKIPYSLLRIHISVENFMRLTCFASLSLYSVENNGFEPLTPCVQSRCSSQLS